MTRTSPSMVLANPARDEALSEEERDFARELLHSYGELVRESESVFSQFCQGRGVPEAVCMRAMIQIALHRAGSNGAHLLAMEQASDEHTASETASLAARLSDILTKQLPVSRETDRRTRAA